MAQMLQLLAFGPDGWGDELASGLAATLLLAGSALPLGLAGGLALALAGHSRRPLSRETAAALGGLLRGVPELLTIFIVYIGGQRLLDVALSALGVEGRFEFSGFVAGVATLAIVFAAYAGEVFLGVLRTLDRSSLEAARALGIGRWPTLRFIILPELFRLSLPGLSNLWLSIIKQSALVSVLGGDELLRKAYIAAASSGRPILFYGVVCLIYIALTTVSEALLAGLHRRLSRGRSHA
jgi:polar amino acid transport system permease protein